ncbi:ThiF family adenylyltransferase [Pseudovibrio sp. Alg231-02]|uniref:ThiF family adenylyltransferase n=1 Tax=Pseudovibrio sp. Alg231-02 TaxID=1922223 RepID=UPI000D550D78|nr:ThiF family adenylyltransferase [Pseudovibrio sp. Alg231-02]
MSLPFSYDEFTGRNIGFLTPDQQEKLANATVFVCGTGGMGGACIMSLVRAGVGRLIIADLDGFEVSNLNRQLFATLDTIDQHKAEATKEACLKINPQVRVDIHREDWPEHIDSIMHSCDVAVNGCDDLGGSLLLYRSARNHGKTVIDAYASPLPSVYVTAPKDPMPEERLDYPTIGTDWNDLTDEQRTLSFLREAEHIVLHSSSRNYVDVKMAGEVASGKRSRMSFAPMVITTGMLMSYEVFAVLLGQVSSTGCRGYFFNPYRARVEHPKPIWQTIFLRPLVRRFLTKMQGT